MGAQRHLAFDPTPAGLVSGRSLRRAYNNEWGRIRKRHFESADLACEICRATQSQAKFLDGHEVYSFPNSEVVRLDRVVFICRQCHDAVHLERTRSLCGGEYVREVERHYCEVNDVSSAELKRDFAEAQRRGLELREFYGGQASSPKVDYGPYAEGVTKTQERQRQWASDYRDDDSEMFPDHECPWDADHSS